MTKVIKINMPKEGENETYYSVHYGFWPVTREIVELSILYHAVNQICYYYSMSGSGITDWIHFAGAFRFRVSTE